MSKDENKQAAKLIYFLICKYMCIISNKKKNLWFDKTMGISGSITHNLHLMLYLLKLNVNFY